MIARPLQLIEEYTMPQSDAQRKATNEYRKRNVRAFNLKFFPADKDLLDWFESQPQKAQYLKDLIRKDMENNN